MRGRTLRTVAVVALVVLAGCVGFAGETAEQMGAGGQETTQSTATAEPTTTQPGASAELAPGLSEDGVTDAWRLALAHASALRDTSYTVTTDQTAWRENGSLAAQTAMVTRFGERPGHVSVSYGVTADDPAALGLNGEDYDVWSDGNRTFTRTTRANGSVVYRQTPGDELPRYGNPADRDALYTYYSSLNLIVVGQIERDGTTLYRLVSTGPLDDTANPALENATLTILLDSNGLVHEYAVSTFATVSTGTYHASRTVRFTNVGETTVERPSWYDEALNETASA